MSENRLRRIRGGGERFISEDFLKGDVTSLEIPDAHIEDLENGVSLEEFDVRVEEIKNDYPKYSAKMDAELAKAVHESLNLTRRQASDRGVWHYLASIHSPDVVRHRWKPDGGRWNKRRFFDGRNRNTFMRLWWIAELTQDGGDYSLTEKALSNQDASVALFERRFSDFPPAVRAFVDTCWDEDETTIRETAKELNRALSTVVLEALDEEDITELLKDIVDKVKN